MRRSISVFFEIRRLRYHVRHWPGDPARRIVLLHGWMDVSASFQFLVDALAGNWDVYAPDWRGYGLTDWGHSDCYWFPDYIADLEALLEAFHADAAVNLVGHSLGGNVAALYAGIRPERVARLVNLEGFGLAATTPDQAPGRYRRWLDELHAPPSLKPYADFDALADRLQKGNPRLSRACGIPRPALGTTDGRREGGVARRSRAQDHQPDALPVRGGAGVLERGQGARAMGGYQRHPAVATRQDFGRGSRGAPRRLRAAASRDRAGCRAHAAP
jgi:pimeloyl-ACP methyl ester carboxylesterase